MRWLIALLLLLPLLGGSQLVLADTSSPQAVPPLRAHVNDLAGVLSDTQRVALEQKLAALETRKGSQLAVLIVHTTQPEDIFSYSFRVADAWHLGRKGVDDGALLVVAVDDHADNIQVGYGLEGSLPDATSKDILDDVIAPHFRQSDYYGGIDAGVDRMIQAIDGEALPKAHHAGQGGQHSGNPLMVVLIAGVVLGNVLRALFNRPLGGLAGGALAAWLAVSLGMALGMAIAAGLMAALVIWMGLLPFGIGGWGGGGYGGGGGYSGGGGGFGGGGASGRW